MNIKSIYKQGPLITKPLKNYSKPNQGEPIIPKGYPPKYLIGTNIDEMLFREDGVTFGKEAWTFQKATHLYTSREGRLATILILNQGRPFSREELQNLGLMGKFFPTDLKYSFNLMENLEFVTLQRSPPIYVLRSK
tara:strand:- start:20 stop:427 length:408 start_codon:yes stop_codon:yes gene_type:complete